MSDARTRALEAAAQRGEPGAAEALARARERAERCRAADHHAWSCRNTTGAVVSYIWCVRCLERRPKDEHEVAVEAYVETLQRRTREVENGIYLRRRAWVFGRVAGDRHDEEDDRARAEVERLTGEVATLLRALLDYREAIAPNVVLAMPAHTPESIGVAVEALPQGEPVRVVVDPPSPTAT